MPIPVREVLASVATTVLVVCALTVTVVSVRDRVIVDPPVRTLKFENQPNWMDYAKVGHRLGSATAKVILVEFADFQCPACRVFDREFQTLQAKYPDDVAVVFRHLPLTRIHPHALNAALASECAAAQGRFGEMHRVLFDRADSLGLLSWPTLAARASVGDLGQFERCFQDPATRAAVDRDVAAAGDLGITGTPTTLMNGVRFSGVPSGLVLDSLVRAALGKRAMAN